MDPVRRLRACAALTQTALARAAGTSQPAIAAYEAGSKSPTVSTLERLAASVGLEAAVDFVPPLTREERRSLALHQAIAGRLAADPDRVLAQARRCLRRMRSGAGASSQLLREWEVLLQRPVTALLPVLTDPGAWARELRQVTPFAGVLSAAERAAVYRAFPPEAAGTR
jgi:transcriptional regulator with XRE-family HTH domain